MLNWTDLKPGLYQLTTPDLVKKMDYPVEIVEDIDTYPGQSGWCHLTGDALRRMKGALGIGAVSNVVRDDTKGITVAVSRGAMLRPDGMLVVYEQSRDYDLNAKLFLAGLKKVRELRNQAASDGGPVDSWTEQETVALATRPTEDAALALVQALPPIIQAEVMENQMEVREHRRALVCSKAENRIYRELIREAGGRTRFKKGFKKTTITFTRAYLKEVLTAEQTAHLTDALYPIEQAAGDRLREATAPATGQAVEDAEDHEARVEEAESPTDVEAREDGEVVTEEGSDEGVIDAEFREEGAEGEGEPGDGEGQQRPWGAREDEASPAAAPPAKQPAPEPAEEEAAPPAAAREAEPSPAAAAAPASEQELVGCEGCEHALSEADVKFAAQGFAAKAFGGRKLCLACRTAAARGDRPELLGEAESK